MTQIYFSFKLKQRDNVKNQNHLTEVTWLWVSLVTMRWRCWKAIIAANILSVMQSIVRANNRCWNMHVFMIQMLF